LLHLVLYRERIHSHDFVWLLLVACTILLYNRIHGDIVRTIRNTQIQSLGGRQSFRMLKEVVHIVTIGL
jgi:hypothetical protein